MRVPQHFERAIWLTPGEVTGWASLSSDMTFSSGQLDFFSLGNELESYARFHHNQLAVGYEQPLGRPGYSREIVGMVKWVAYKYNTTLLPPVSFASSEPGREDDKLQKLRWYKPDRDEANDAAAHLLAWLLREGRTPMHLAAELFST